MVESVDNTSPEENLATTAKRPYQKPGIDWEQKMEPITHAITCVHTEAEGLPCIASPNL